MKRPTFSHSPGVGISLCRDFLEIIQLRGNHGGFDVQAHVDLPLSGDVYDNGHIHDTQQFARELERVFGESGLPRRGITLNLPSSLVFIRTLHMPPVKRKQMRELITFRMREDLHFPFANPVFDFDYYPENLRPARADEEDGEGIPILLVATPGDVIQGLQDAFQQADIHLSAVELKGLSILRALRAMQKRPEKGTIVIECTPSGVEAHFYHQNIFFLTRTLELSPEQYVELAAAAVEESQAHTPDGESTADLAAHAVSTAREMEKTAWRLLHQPEHENSLVSFIHDLAYQVERWISFFQYSLNQREVVFEQIWLTYDIPQPSRFVEELSSRLDLPVEIVRWPVIFTPRKGEPASPLVSLAAAGAALRGLVSDAD